mgnify:CR=1 FL=1
MISEAEKVKKMKIEKKFVRYKEGAILYSMSQNKFEAFAKEAKATYKVGGIVLVNTKILDQYIEQFRVIEREDNLWQE